MTFQQAEQYNDLLMEGIKHFRYGDALLKMSRRIKPKNLESKEIKKLSFEAAMKFKMLEHDYINAVSKKEKKELKLKYKQLKKEYSELIKKINIKRAMLSVGGITSAALLMVAGLIIKGAGGTDEDFMKYLNEYNASLEPLYMNDELVEKDIAANKSLIGDVTKTYKRDGNDTVGMRANKIRREIFNSATGKEKDWEHYRSLEKEVDDLARNSKGEIARYDRAWDKLTSTEVMKKYGFTKEFKERIDYLEGAMRNSRTPGEMEKYKEEYDNLIAQIEKASRQGKEGKLAAQAVKDTKVKNIFDQNMRFIDRVTSMDMEDYERATGFKK